MLTQSLDTFELLSNSGLASGMSLEQVQVLAGCGKLETYEADELLVDWDDQNYDLMLLVGGRCELRTQMNDVLYHLGAGALIGEISFLDERPRSAKAVAVEVCQVIRFPVTLLADLESTRPDVVAKLLKNISLVLCQKLRSTTRFAEASFV
jgi:CRP/FNR family cyclic AMP-dependent transcriptional regulator